MRKRIVALFLVTLITLTGCNKQVSKTTSNTNDNSQISSNETVANNTNDDNNETSEEEPKQLEFVTKTASKSINELKEKYNYNSNKYIKPLYNVDETTQFVVHFNSKVEPIKAVTVHTDKECDINSSIYQINSAYESNGGYTVIVRPGTPILNSSEREDGVFESYNWGNAPIYYLSINYDIDATTPTKLEEPMIIPFTVKREVSTPNLYADVTEEGLLKLRWKPVENAVKYNIYMSNPIGNTSVAFGMSKSQIGYTNENLVLIGSAYDDTTEFSELADELVTIDSNEYVIAQNQYDIGTYYVTAVDADGNESSFSNEIDGTKYKSMLPTSFNFSEYFDKNEENQVLYLPLTVPVEMADKSTRYYPISYSKVNEFTEGYATYEYNVVGTKLTGKIDILRSDKIYAPYYDYLTLKSGDIIEFNDNVDFIPNNSVEPIYINKEVNIHNSIDLDADNIIKYSKDTLMQRASIESERISNDGIYADKEGPSAMLDKEKLEKSDAGSVTKFSLDSISTINVENLVLAQIEITRNQVDSTLTNELPSIDVDYFADSAEEEYLAINLIACNSNISLQAFPSLQNTEYLKTILDKVLYQNPYILDYDSSVFNFEASSLVVEYKDTQENIHNKQQLLLTEAKNMLGNILTAEMSDEEKIEAIYMFMNEHTEYNNKEIDEDSTTAYGLICKKCGISQSYVNCFKLLLELCGIKCDNVLGYIDQSSLHIWNKVTLGDNSIYYDTVNDITNNSIPNVLYGASKDDLNTSNYKVLHDDKVDKSSSEIEWYHKNNRFANSKESLLSIISNIKSEGNSSIYAIRSSYEPQFNDEFISSVSKSLDIPEEKAYGLRMGYINGLFILYE